MGGLTVSLTKVIVKPDVKDALEFIEKTRKPKGSRVFFVIIGDCMVDYRGRARSFLDWGERVVMIKQDGTLLVHQPVKREPVNWQPSGSITECSVENNYLVLRSRHSRPPEKMKISFRSLKLVAAVSLRDKADLVIVGMESDVVNEIVNNPNIIEEGLRICKREKHVKSGLIDLFGYDQNHIPVVIEVKRSTATISAVQQLRMYVNDVKKDVEESKVRGILCAPRIPSMVKKLLSDYGLEWREVERRVVLPDDKQKTLKDFKKT